MVDFVLELIDFNEGVDYQLVINAVLIYLAVLWLFVSIWVFNDARVRFNSKFIAAVFAIFTLLLSVPFLLIYLLIRPAHKEEWEEWHEVEGGINLPLVNFTGEEGAVISLQIRINSDKIVNNKDASLKFDLNLESSDDETLELVEKSSALNQSQSKDNDHFRKIPAFFVAWKGRLGVALRPAVLKITTSFSRIKTKVKQLWIKLLAREEEGEENNTEEEKGTKGKRKKRNKKKKSK